MTFKKYTLEALCILVLGAIASIIYSTPGKPPVAVDNAPILQEYTAHMDIFQKNTGKNAYGFSVITDQDNVGWVCYLDRPLGVGSCHNTIPTPEIP